MKIETFTEVRTAALQKWREYKEAAKQSANPIYKDLQKVYNQMKTGKKVIDIFKVIQKGGIHESYHPKLAIAKASAKKILCKYRESGTVSYCHDLNAWRETKEDVVLPTCLPPIPKTIFTSTWQNELKLKAPVPPIPPKYLPKILTDDYYILWEVDVWEMVPPTDPWLLKRVTENHFVLLAGWDLTPLEKSVMRGRMY